MIMVSAGGIDYHYVVSVVIKKILLQLRIMVTVNFKIDFIKISRKTLPHTILLNSVYGCQYLSFKNI